MTRTRKVLSGIILSTLLSSGLYAVNNEKKNSDDSSNCMMKKDGMHDGKHQGNIHSMGMFKGLNLSAEQETQIEKIMLESRKDMKTIDDAFTKDSFDKDKYMKIMSEKRDNMLKSNAEVMEKSYAILTPKQKEQFKVLLDLRKEKMNQRIENKIKG